MSHVIPLNSRSLRGRRFGVCDALVAVIVFTLMGLLFSTTYAFADQELTKFLGTKAFQGSSEIIIGLNFLGKIFNLVITIFCFIGLSLLIMQRIITCTYLAGRVLFDNVYDMKAEARDTSWFGFPNMGKQLYQGKRGVGLDAFVGFFYMFIPNLKVYSDYNPDKILKNLDPEEDSIVNYLLKTLPTTVLIGLVLTMGFSGSLAKGYAMLIDGAAAVMDVAVEQNLEGWVKRKLSTGESHQFTLGKDGSPTGKLGERIAKDIYSKAISRLDLVDSNSKLIIGRNCEQWVIDNVLGGSTDPGTRINAINEIVQSAAIEGATDTLSTQVRTDADVNACTYSISVNTVPYIGSESNPVGKTVALADLVDGLNLESFEGGNDFYVHLMISKTKITEASYFAPSADDAKAGTVSSGGSTTPN